MKDRILDDWLDSYLILTNNSEPSTMFRLWSGISVISGVLQRKCRLDWGELVFYPNLYTVLVGPPAARKGTAMNQAFPFLENLNIKIAAESITREALIQELKNSNDNDLDVKTGKMYFHSSLTIWAQELTVFLGYNNLQLLSDLTDWYDCRNKWTYRTKNMGTDEIIGVYVSLFGATTPDLLRSTMPLDAIGGGLTSRMIFVFEWDKEKLVVYTGLNEEEKRLKENLFIDLEKIRMLSGVFKTTPEVLEIWAEWYTQQEKNPPFKDSRFNGYFQRRGNHIMKLAMICSASRCSDMIITGNDFKRAINILSHTEKNMPYTFSGVGKATHADTMAKIYTDLRMAGDRGMKYSELLAIYRDDADNFILDNIISTLKAMKYVETIINGNDTVIKAIKLDKD